MVIWTSLLLLVLTLLLLLFLKQLWSRRHFPPGPLSLPFIGNVWIFGATLDKDSFAKLAKRYGKMYTLWLGNHPVVVLSGYKTVKEGLVGFSEEFSGRPETVFYKTLKKGQASGVAFANGHIWEKQRHTAEVILQKLGMEGKSIEDQIEAAACQLVEIFARKKGQPFDPSPPLFGLTVNMISLLSFGYKFDPEDEKLQKLIQCIECTIKYSGGFFHLMYEGSPWLMKFIPGPHKRMEAAFGEIVSFAKVEIDNQQKHQSLHKPQDFIDFYLLEIDKCRNDPNTTFTEESLALVILDLVISGTDSLNAFLKWAMLLLANHPNIQEKVHKEIEDVFGSSSSISYQDQKKMPYTHAVIHELLRAKYIALLPLPRQITKDVKMQGFHIPKGTLILPDLLSVLHDPEQWETPEEFNPNHFLDTEGNFISREAFLPFGAGKRVCLGEKLARKESFIVLISLLRAFRFQHPEGVKVFDETCVPSMDLHPHPFKICAVPHNILS